MGELFLKLLNMSLTAGWLILAVICFRFVFQKTPKWVNCLLWSLVAIRLICPFSIESAFGLLSSTEPIKDTAVVADEVQNYIPSVDSNLHIINETINPMLARSFAYEEYNSIAPLQVVTFICGIVWSSGMILLILYALISLFRLHFRMREAVPYKNNIMICDAVKSPFILGMFRPRIYLYSGLNENEIEYIVAHEQAHLKRRDHIWKPIGYLLLCVYWFQPLCWVAYILFCKDIELACDEKVIKNMDIQDKKDYSRTLLSCANQKKMVLACPLAFGEVGVRERVKSVLNYKKPTFWMVFASIVACLVIAMCFLTTSPNNNLDEKMEETSEAVAEETPDEILEETPEWVEEEINAERYDVKTERLSEVLLYDQPEPDKVCIRVQPSEYRELLSYYYIPIGKDQEWISNRVRNLDLGGKDFARRMEGKKEVGWQIVYNDISLNVFEGGYLYYTYTDDSGIKECLIEDPKLCDYIQGLLLEKLNYASFDVTKIKDVVSAKLNVSSHFTGFEFYSQTITDETVLEQLEKWFRNAEYMRGGADCCNESACLELTLGNGEIVKLSMATDSCPNFGINGVYYDYRPMQKWDNREFYKYFDEIPYNQQDTNGTVARNGTEKAYELTTAETKVIVNILENGSWDTEGTGDCINDCKLIFDGKIYYYHSECGTFNDSQNNRNLELTAPQKESVNDIFEKYISLDSVEVPMKENRVPDILSVASITIVNGDTGEEMIFNRTDSTSAFNDLLELYDQLDFVADAEENARVGYRYCMKLQDAEGDTIQMVTPYKDGFTIDGTFYKYNGEDALDFSAVNLMNYIDSLFHPAARAAENSVENTNTNNTLEYVTELQSKISEAMMNDELSFVTSSSVYENPYRLHVVVNSENESDLRKLKAFDEKGDFLVIEYVAGNVNELE